jgi:hypothetical protein
MDMNIPAVPVTILQDALRRKKSMRKKKKRHNGEHNENNFSDNNEEEVVDEVTLNENSPLEEDALPVEESPHKIISVNPDIDNDQSEDHSHIDIVA